MKTKMTTELNDQYLRSVVASVKDAATRLQANLLTSSETPLDLIGRLKFEQSGFNPAPEKCCEPYNLIEQVNQSMTYLVTVLAVHWLKSKHPTLVWMGNLGPQGGSDIESDCGTVACEVFAAVDKNNNKKLSRDIVKVRKNEKATQRYVFCALGSWDETVNNKSDDKVRVVQFKREDLLALTEL
jgi:hypothetical protein